jgi:hypothetical protein
MEYTVRLVGRFWYVVRVEGFTEKVLALHFGTKQEAEAVAKHLTYAKRPAGQQPERTVN